MQDIDNQTGEIGRHPMQGTVVPLLEVRNLSISFRTANGVLNIVPDLSFSVGYGERLAVVGESGSGKTITGLALIGLLPRNQAVLNGQILFEGRNLIGLSEQELRAFRGRQIGMVFQEPMSALDPVFTIGQQIVETIRHHFGISARAARERAVEMLDKVGIPAARKRVDEYPHQLSGGMRQRAMLAIALACEPRMLIADEPTTALDVTIQAQILELMVRLSEETRTAILFISHDLGAVSEVCSRMLTMYAGQLVEDAVLDAVLRRPLHPYTSGLLRSLPRFSRKGDRLPSIGGRVPPPTAMPSGCRFEQRCVHAIDACRNPQMVVTLPDGRRVCCHRHAELHLPGSVD